MCHMGWVWSDRVGCVIWVGCVIQRWGVPYRDRVCYAGEGGSYRDGVGQMGGVGQIGVMQGGMGHTGLGWVMQGWGGWVMVG